MLNYPTSVCLAGASGLVGHELLKILSQLDGIDKIIAMSRSPLGKIPSNVENLIVNFENLESYAPHLQAGIFICCLGTTIKNAGSQENFVRVDFEYCLNFAKLAQKVGAKKILIITAMGADSNSKFFYNQTKGRLETEVKKINLEQIEFFRPSLILGERKENRPVEKIAQKISPFFNKILEGPFRKYKSIKATDIAKAMAVATLNFNSGISIYESDEIQKIADQVKYKN
jgi:uncharacterized protein YbjT (DUF2867 family)